MVGSGCLLPCDVAEQAPRARVFMIPYGGVSGHVYWGYGWGFTFCFPFPLPCCIPPSGRAAENGAIKGWRAPELELVMALIDCPSVCPECLHGLTLVDDVFPSSMKGSPMWAAMYPAPVEDVAATGATFPGPGLASISPSAQRSLSQPWFWAAERGPGVGCVSASPGAWSQLSSEEQRFS